MDAFKNYQATPGLLINIHELSIVWSFGSDSES